MNIKKSLIVLLIINLMLFSLTSYKTDAAVVSKVASSAAKKVAKEVVKDSAVQMAMDIVFEYEMSQMMQEDYRKPDSGYTPVCLEKKGDKCSKPAQVKIPTTTTEKKALADKVEEVLEKKTNTHTGWGKFLDWFVPIFLVSGAISWITAQFDNDTKNLFDEVAKQSLSEMGYIRSLVFVGPVDIVDSSSGKPISQPSITDLPVSGLPNVSIPAAKSISFELDFSNSGITTKTVSLKGQMSYLNSLIMIEFSSNNLNNWVKTVEVTNYDGWSWYMSSLGNQISSSVRGKLTETASSFNTESSNPRNVVINGSSSSQFDLPNLWQPTRIIISGKGGEGNYGVEGHISTYGGNVGTFEGPVMPFVNNAVELGSVSITSENMRGYALKAKVSIYPSSSSVNLDTYNPDLGEFPELSFDKSIYNSGDGTYKIPSPSVIPIKTSEGTFVKPDGNGGWQDLEGNPIEVDENTLIVGDIELTQDSDDIVSPDGTVLPKPQDKTENLSCDRELKNIEFKKVGRAFTNAFPFSIPWDIKRFIDSSLMGVGNEKPIFELTFLGSGVFLTIPDFFDSWIPFVHGIIIVFFDIGIILFFYRIMKGGGD